MFIFCKTKTKKQIPENCIGEYFYPSPFQMVIYGILRVFNQILGTNVANKGKTRKNRKEINFQIYKTLWNVFVFVVMGLDKCLAQRTSLNNLKYNSPWRSRHKIVLLLAS